MSEIGAINKTLLHDDMLIGMVLSHFHALREAQALGKVASEALHDHPIVSFGRKADGQLMFGQEITEATLEYARIRLSPKGAEPQYRYFKRIHASDGTSVQKGEGAGLSASAWAETNAQGHFQYTDGKCDLRICYPGYPPQASAAQTSSMSASLRGEFPQVREVGPFLAKVMSAAKALGLPTGNVINTSWSMGAANALSSNLYFKHKRIPTVAILGDPWRSSAAVNNIAMREDILHTLLNGSHAEALHYSQPQLRKLLAQDVVSVYPAIEDQAGAWKRTSMTAPGPVKVKVPLLGEISRFPRVEKLGAMPFGETVGQVVHLDARGMEVLEHLPWLGDSHQRTNIIHHLANHGDGILHEIPQVATGQATSRGVV